MSIRDKLAALGLRLPDLEPPLAAFVPFVRTGVARDLVFLSGHIAMRGGAPWVGRLGDGMTTADGAAAARAIAIDLLATLERAAGGDLDRVARIVKLLVLVSSAPSFTEQHLVANGASQLLLDVFGERGAHARSAIGVAQLPLGACVEIELVAELAPA
jgi:enamine deaminase RidA (YjgF/YER057c/UK114 family)